MSEIPRTSWAYRSHKCGVLRLEHADQTVRLSGWIHRKRDHGQMLFMDLRDDSGSIQLVIDDPKMVQEASTLTLETVISIEGKVVARSPETINVGLSTGSIEIHVSRITCLSQAKPLPFPVNQEAACSEELRLKYRFLDLRRDALHQRIVLRSHVISALRQAMIQEGFLELQTPILGPYAPEGARDYLVPSRLHPGHFYALPQAPQLFKQMYIASGFDRYFQIAPCFRDEDARADRAPGEFYQLDFEMAFATQEDIFGVLERVLVPVFERFGQGKKVTQAPFPRIPYKEALETYGSDKPDLRNPLRIEDRTECFRHEGFPLFVEAIGQQHKVKSITVSQGADQPRRFFEEMNVWAQSHGLGGIAYIAHTSEGFKGPLVKYLQEATLQTCAPRVGDLTFILAEAPGVVQKIAGKLRQHLGEHFDLIEKNTFRFCLVQDFPMYEYDETLGRIAFSHNPFSMPQGGMEALLTQDPLDILAYQYDIVCNGIELSSGAIRNHLPDVMYKAFEIGGYTAQDVVSLFGSMLKAFELGVPPHGGSAPGVDRIVMLLADVPNLREVVAFPLNQQAQDLLMNSPVMIAPEKLSELHLDVKKVQKA